MGNEGNDTIAVGTGEVQAEGGSGNDLIDLSAVASTVTGDDAFPGAGQLRAVDVGRGSVVQATTDGDVDSEAEIALVSTTGLAADDFVL